MKAVVGQDELGLFLDRVKRRERVRVDDYPRLRAENSRLLALGQANALLAADYWYPQITARLIKANGRGR